MTKPKFECFLFFSTENEIFPVRKLDLIQRSTSILDDLCCFMQNLLEHRFHVPMHNAVAFDPADAIANVVEDLALHGEGVHSLLDGGVGVG